MYGRRKLCTLGIKNLPDVPDMIDACDEFHRYVTDATRKTTPSMHSKEEVSYMIACSIGSTLGVLHKWTRENFESSEEIIAGILTQSFLTGILPYLS